MLFRTGLPRAGRAVNALCAGNDTTFEFLEGVLSEVMDLFPSKYIHIGGDEVDPADWKNCPKCQARIKKEGLKNESDLQNYFSRRIDRFVLSKNRVTTGWDEEDARKAGVAPYATVMSWKSIEAGIAAANANLDVVISPGDYCYLDHYQSKDHSREPRAIGGYLPLEIAYSFEPIPAEVSPQQRKHILGVQGNVWTEYIASFKHVEYMTYPRACAIAEVAWSPKESRNWEDFTRRMQTHLQRLDQLGVNYRRLTPN